MSILSRSLAGGMPLELSTRFLRQTSWALIATVCGQASGLMTSILVARVLGAERFGEYALLQSTAVLLGLVGGGCFGVTAARFVGAHWETDSERTSTVLGTTLMLASVAGACVCFALILSAPLASTYLHYSPAIVGALPLVGLLVWFNSIHGVQCGALTGFASFRSLAKVQALRAILQLPLAVAGGYLGGVSGVLIGMVFIAMISTIVGGVQLSRAARKVSVVVLYFVRTPSWGEIRAFSVPALVADVVMSPATWLVNVWLTNSPNGLSEMAIFSAASQWRTAILFIPSVVGQVLMPMMAGLHEGRRNEFRHMMFLAMCLNGACAVCVLIGLTVFGSRVMSLYGRSFAARNDVLIITALCATAMAVQAPLGNALMATGRMWTGAALNAFAGGVLLVSGWFFIQSGWGAAGGAMAFLVAYVAMSVVTGAIASQLLRERYEAVIS